MARHWITLFILSAGISISAQTNLQRRTADKLFEQGDHFHAMEGYKQLLNDNPNDPELNYNVGNSLYRMQQYAKAMQFYQRALDNATDAKLKNAIEYNMANCLMKLRKSNEAIEGYKKVLRSDPDDADARKNLEMALRMEPPKPPPSKGEDNKSDKKKNQDQDQNKDQEQKKQSGKQDPNKQNEKENSRDPKSDANQRLNKKEAERILDALKNQERDYQKRKLKEKVNNSEKTDKDW